MASNQPYPLKIKFVLDRLLIYFVFESYHATKAIKEYIYSVTLEYKDPNIDTLRLF